MGRFTPSTFGPPKNSEDRIECYFCGNPRYYTKQQLTHMKTPYRCKKCSAQIRAGHIEDVIHK